MDKLILEHYKKLILFFNNVLESQYEVILYQWNQEEPHLKLAATSTDAETSSFHDSLEHLQKVVEENYPTSDYVSDFEGARTEASSKKTSLFFIKNDDRDLIGVLCVSMDVSKYQDLSKQILALVQLNKPTIPQENAQSSTDNVSQNIADIITKTLGEPFNKKMSLNQQTKVEIVRQLDVQSIFQIKGSVTEVAKQLDCSDASIYRYLNKINQKNA